MVGVIMIKFSLDPYEKKVLISFISKLKRSPILYIIKKGVEYLQFSLQTKLPGKTTSG